MTGQITESEMRDKLLEAVRADGSQKAWAAAHGISLAYVNDCLKRGKPIGAAIAEALGYKPVTVYVPIEGNAHG